MNLLYYLVSLLFLYVCSIKSVPQDIVSPNDTPKKFRNDYKYEASTETFYKVHKIIKTFQDAVSTCKYEGAELAVPKTEAEADLLKSMFRKGSGAIWVGLHDIFAEGEFITIDGQSIDDVYGVWEDGEPNNVNDIEDCIIMVENKRYNDVSCTSKYHFICAKPDSGIEYQWLCDTHDKDYAYNTDGDRCYKLHNTPRSWHEAFKICRAEEAALAVVNSEVEAKFLSNSFNTQYPENKLQGNFNKHLIFVDFSDLITPGVFLTSNGKSLEVAGYNIWAPEQPDNYKGIEHCGSMTRAAQLNDVDCNDSKALFFCEKVLGAPLSFALLERVGFNNTEINVA